MNDPIRQFAKRTIRYRLQHPLVNAANRLSSRIGDSPRTQVLLASDLEAYTSEQQFAPLLRWSDELLEKHQIELTHLYAFDLMKLPSSILSSFDAVVLKFAFTQSKERVLDCVRVIKSKLRSEIPIIYFDGDDDSCVQWAELLPEVNLYVKKHMFVSQEDYLRAYVGKSNLTDYVAATHAISFAEDPIPETPALSPDFLHKITVGWNIAFDDKIVTLMENADRPTPLDQRSIDVCSRAFCEPTMWIYPLRNRVVAKLRALEPTAKVLTPETRVPPATYYQEMADSKICVSPFGYGEICWRDFEAILSGCVLVKPSMRHIKTVPDVFAENETYAPVRWDFEDLPEVIANLLRSPEDMDRLRFNAFERLVECYRNKSVIPDFVRILKQAGVVLDDKQKVN